MEPVTFSHAAERFVIHFFSSAGVWLIALWGFWLLERKVRWWPAPGGWWELILPALLSFVGISFREVFDVAGGQPVAKAVSDWLSWVLGLGAAAWAFYRLIPRGAEILREMQQQRGRSPRGAGDFR